MPARKQFSDEVLNQILSDFHSDMSGAEIGKKYECDYFRTVRRIWLSKYTEQDLKQRHRRLSALHKIGNLNPMYGKSGYKHHNYKPVHIDVFGYRKVDAPSWYTGSVDKGKVAEHILVACEAAGLTQLPDGHVVHHKDEDKTNNHPDNLEIMLRGTHMVTHRWLRHRKKVQRLSRKGVGSKQSRSAQHHDGGDDIVCSHKQL